MDDRVAISVPDLARLLGVSKPTAYKLVRCQDFPSFKIGSRVMVYANGLEQWVKAQADNRLDGDVDQ